ncbi:MAG: alpha/beta hydrolase [bacterium]|nr:alpha/beta hydrolase [bacterium]
MVIVRTTLMVSLVMGVIATAFGQSLPEPARVIPLYEGVAPGSENWDWEEKHLESRAGLPMIQNVVRPVLMYYPPDPGTDVATAMIIAPGGGFRSLMMSYEGVDVAKYLNKLGVHAYVLKYRLIHQQDRTEQAVQDVRKLAAADGQQAVRLLRRLAQESGGQPDRIGMIGFSAGGHVTLATVMGPADGRPDFAVPVYAAVGSKWDLPITVPEQAPPLCIFTAADDQVIPWERSMELFAAWKNAGYLAEIHIFQAGAHGFREQGGGADHYLDRLQEWMRVNGWLSKEH